MQKKRIELLHKERSDNTRVSRLPRFEPILRKAKPGFKLVKINGKIEEVPEAALIITIKGKQYIVIPKQAELRPDNKSIYLHNLAKKEAEHLHQLAEKLKLDLATALVTNVINPARYASTAIRRGYEEVAELPNNRSYMDDVANGSGIVTESFNNEHPNISAMANMGWDFVAFPYLLGKGMGAASSMSTALLRRAIGPRMYWNTLSMSDEAKAYSTWKSMADRLRNELTFDPSQNKIVHLDDTGLLPVDRRGFVPKTDTSKYEIGVSPELENDGWSSFVIDMGNTPKENPAIWWNRNKPYYFQDHDLSTDFQRALVADADKVGAKGATRADGTVVKTEGTIPFSDVQGFEPGIGPWYNRVLYLGSHALNPTQTAALGTLTWQKATSPYLRFSSDIDWNLASKTLSSKELEAFQRMTPELLKSASKDYPQLFTSNFVPTALLLTVKYYPYMRADLLQAVLDAIQRRITFVNGPKFLSRLDRARSKDWFKKYTDNEIRRAMISRFYLSENPTTVKSYNLGQSNGKAVGDGSELILNSELPPVWNSHVAAHETYHASTRNIKPKRDDGLSLKTGPKNRDEEILLEVMSYNNSLAPHTPLLYPYNIKLENGVESPISSSFARYMRDPQERGAEAWAILDHFGTDENAAIQALQTERAIGKPTEATGAFSNLLKKFNATSSPEGGLHYMKWFLGLAPWLTFGTAAMSYKKGGSIHIKEKNKGKFTASAKKAGLSVLEYAKTVLSDPNATTLLKKRANFARNAKKWKH